MNRLFGIRANEVLDKHLIKCGAIWEKINSFNHVQF
jgi:hypothetical protein